MSGFEEGQIKIHTENIFPIIKKAVYSDHEIFLRELISNAVDAISKRRMASIGGDCIEGENEKIQIIINKEKKSITIKDNGIGMTADEVKKYINQVAFSSAEEFLEKYKQDQDQIIGHFGLGFYSSFMVASHVEIKTLSAKIESEAVEWKCDGSPNFSLGKIDKEEIGTDIILTLMDEEIEFLEPSRIQQLIKKYCDFMPCQIEMDGEVINKQSPPWRKNAKELEEKDYKELYNYLYPYQGDPLFWIHLKTDFPYNLNGILFFPKITGRADWESGEIKLYSNQVFVSDSIKEIVPRFLLPLRGVIDSTDIPLNVSRSALQADRRVRSIATFITKKIADKLREIVNEKPSFYAEIWDSISPFIKIGVMEDEKFSDLVNNLIYFKTSLTNFDHSKITDNTLITHNEIHYTTIDGYKNRSKEGTTDNILYCTDEISQSSALQLWKSQGAEVITADTVIDTQLIPWFESKNKDYKFQRVDAELDESLKERKPEITDQEGGNQYETLSLLMKAAIGNENVTIQVQSIKGDEAPPALILLPEQMRRMNDMGALMEQRLPGLPENHVLLVNFAHPLVCGLQKIKAGSILVNTGVQSSTESLATDLAKHIYDMARLSVGGLEPKEITEFQKKEAELMGKLLQKAL